MTKEEIEEALLKAFEIGTVFGYAMHELYGDDLSMQEVKACARNKYETIKEESNGG